MQLPTFAGPARLRRSGEVDIAPYGERLISRLLDAVELLGRELGGAVLMVPCWPAMAVARPHAGLRDDI